MQSITNFLNSLAPLVSFVCLLFGVLAAWKGLLEVVPIISQIVPVTVRAGSAQAMATVAGALALVVIAMRGKV